jgi:lipopolysaccharide heptosyltransferase I
VQQVETPEISFASPPQRILIIKPSAIGDVVHALPVLNLLRKRFPTAHISWLVTPTCSGLLEGHPQLDEVILFQRGRFGTSWWNPKVLAEMWRLNRRLRRGQFDLVLDLQGLLRSGYLSWKTGAPVRVGFTDARELSWIFHTHRVPADLRTQHAVYRYLQMSRAIGCGDEPVEFHFPTDDADRKAVAAMLPENKPYAVLLPGSNWPTKRWPTAYFAELADGLRRRLGLEPVIAGSAGDNRFAEQINGINLCGKTNLRQLVALLEKARIVIANDSGPMHIAAALGRPLIALYGPTDFNLTGPYGRDDTVMRLGLPCSPCLKRRCVHQSCLRWIHSDAALERAEKELASSS